MKWLALALAVPAMAMQPSEPVTEAARTDAGAGFYVSWGFGGMMPGGAWGPIRVNVGTGDRAIAGAVIVRYQQDSTQNAQIVTPFAATPNKVTPVQVIARLPEGCDAVSITLMDERGSILASERYEQNATEAGKKLPLTIGGRNGLVVSVGRNSLADAVRDWTAAEWRVEPRRQAVAPRRATGRPAQSARPDSETRLTDEAVWRLMVGARIEPGSMPLSWMGYDGVLALAIDSSIDADPVAAQAVRKWVESGGRLLLVAADPGEGWRQWLPAEAARAIVPGPALAMATPKALEDALGRAREVEHVRATVGEDASLAAAIPAPAPEAKARALRLTPEARGWVVRWRTEDDAGLLAEGPCGFGWVTVLGVDPSRVPETVSTRATGGVWRSALESAIDDWLTQPDEQRQMWFAMSLGPRNRATNAVLDALADVPLLGTAVFLAIGGCMGALAILLGPGDFFVLRCLRARHRSWLTALGWIALATVGAYALPRFIRAESSRVNGITMIDRYAAPLTGGGSLGFHTSFTGLYAARSGTAKVREPAMLDWTCGVAAENYYGMGSSVSATAMVPMVQSAAGGEAGSERGNVAATLPLGLWTFRTLMHEGPDRGSIVGRVEPAESGHTVTLGGLPKEAKVVSAALRVGGRWLSTSPVDGDFYGPPEDPHRALQRMTGRRRPTTPHVETPKMEAVGEQEAGAWTGDFRHEWSRSMAPTFWASTLSDQEAQTFGVPWATARSPFRPGMWLGAPGADRRGQSIERRLESGTHAVLYLYVEEWPARTTISWSARERQAAVLRVLIPLEAP
ncbi:MAG: hypothetical protein ACKVW3_04390 [Phycisphaerales bacterium]